MERFANNVRLLWGAERLLIQQEIRTGTKRLGIMALAGLIAAFGLAMLGVAVFFAIEPYWGRSLAALTVAGIDLVIAAGLIAAARAVKTSEETAMVKEMREMAVNGIKDEAAQAGAEIDSLKSDIHDFARNPVGTLLPAVVSPMLGAVTRGLRGVKKKK